MESFTLILLLLAAVLASSVIDQIIPRVSLPLVQIVIGLLIAVFAQGDIELTLDPELFLVLFIAPLLYDEARKADKEALWREIKPTMSLVIGLVVATTLIIGFIVNAIVPSIPLAAAFALGAALGPTDAVAVSSLSKTVDIPKRQAGMLKGELLLNDASGIVSFQFAVAAVVTGTFSLFDASIDFLIEFVGGLGLGLLLGFLGNAVVKRIRGIGMESTNFHVLFEVLTPFLVYLVADTLHVSGVISVVVVGLFNIMSPRTISASVSRMNIVSTSVWRVLSYALNGIVFVLLGTQLPNAMRESWDNVAISNTTLILLVLGLTVVLLGVRFIWVLIMDVWHIRRAQKRPITAQDIRSSTITTFSGAKGTITLSIMFSLPMYITYHPYAVMFPQRDLLIFLASGVIVCTLVLATFVVPLLAPKKDKNAEEIKRHEQDTETTLEILRRVIEMLATNQTEDTRFSTQNVINSYNERVAAIKEHNDIDDGPNNKLRLRALEWEHQYAEQLIKLGRVSPQIGYLYLDRLEQSMHLLAHDDTVMKMSEIRVRLRVSLYRLARKLSRTDSEEALTNREREYRHLQIKTREYAINELEEAVASSNVPTEDAAALLVEYQRNVATLRNTIPRVTTAIKIVNHVDDIKRRAYEYELEQIQEMYEEEKLSRAGAKHLRENVNLMLLDLDDSV